MFWKRWRSLDEGRDADPLAALAAHLRDADDLAAAARGPSCTTIPWQPMPAPTTAPSGTLVDRCCAGSPSRRTACATASGTIAEPQPGSAWRGASRSGAISVREHAAQRLDQLGVAVSAPARGTSARPVARRACPPRPGRPPSRTARRGPSTRGTAACPRRRARSARRGEAAHGAERRAGGARQLQHAHAESARRVAVEAEHAAAPRGRPRQW